MTIRRLQQQGRLSGGVIDGNLVYLAGQVTDHPDLDAETQTADVLRQIDGLLAEAGTDKSRLLTCQVFLADMADMADITAMNRAWDRWLDTANPPARATVEARLVDPRWKVEISGIAALP